MKWRYIHVTVLLFLLAGCGGSDSSAPPPTQVDPTLTSIQSGIFNVSCALSGCHAGASPQASLNLSQGSSFDNLVGITSQEVPTLLRVNPGDPDNSYLIQKLEGTAAVGARMPFGRPALSQENINAVRQWIADGANP